MIPFRWSVRTTFATLLLAVCVATLPAARALADSGAEDAKLLAFLDRAFDESVARSPETLTSLGIKRDYDKLDDYTDEDARKNLELAEKHLAQMKAMFKAETLGPQARLSYQL